MEQLSDGIELHKRRHNMRDDFYLHNFYTFRLILIQLVFCQVIEQFRCLYAWAQWDLKENLRTDQEKRTKEDIAWCQACNDAQMSLTTYKGEKQRN